jgi:hypothetical protein
MGIKPFRLFPLLLTLLLHKVLAEKMGCLGKWEIFHILMIPPKGHYWSNPTYAIV